ncbi:MAG TPA: hypothetical protein VFW46_14725 [Stellaceae bacterium]|nr:hypothetical protein [Stellaceae bacterium]
MTDGPHRTEAKKAELAAREARLAKALRENLARRKEQSRARRSPKPSAPPEKPPA